MDPNSQTDTFAAVTFFIDNWRWAGVPFYIRTGKSMPKRVTDIAIQFNTAPHALFDGDTSGRRLPRPNLLILRIQPEEGISLRFLSKQSRERHASCGRYRWISITGRASASAHRRLTRRCWWMRWSATPRSTRGRTWWRRVGAPSSRFWTCGRRNNFDFPNYPAGILGARGFRRDAGAQRPPLEEQLTYDYRFCPIPKKF